MRLGWVKMVKNANFQPINRYVSAAVEDMHILVVTMKAQQEVGCRLLIGTSFDDLLTLNNRNTTPYAMQLFLELAMLEANGDRVPCCLRHNGRFGSVDFSNVHVHKFIG